MATQANDPQAYKEIVVRDVKTILSALNKDLPWLVADIALSMHDRMGQNNAFVKKVLGDVLASLSEEDLESISVECTPGADARIRQLTIGITGAEISSERVHEILAKPAFSLDSDDCAPCGDGESGPIAMGVIGESAKKQFEKIKLAQHILEDIEKLEAHKKAMLTNAEEFKDEITGVKTILEVLDARCHKS